MIAIVSMVYAYYENPGMLRRQLEEWMHYSEEEREVIDFIIVDDGSPNDPAMRVVENSRVPLNLSVYRVAVDKPWGQDAARNIGMKEACTSWCLMTDMDHMVSRSQAPKLLHAVTRASKGTYYMPMRVRTSGALYHAHPNSFLFNRDDFWEMGGYDEDFVGFYGSDGNFRKCAKGAGLRESLTEDFRLILYGSNDIVDAHTRAYTRKEGQLWSAKNPVLNAKRMGPAYRAINPFRQSYTRLL